MSSSIENIEKVLGAKRFGDRSAQIDWILLIAVHCAFRKKHYFLL